MSLLRSDDLAGVLRVTPGQPRPHNLISTRRDWAALLTRGVPAASLPTRLGSLFSLCGHAHRLCAEMAVAAAQSLAPAAGTTAAKDLQRETLREHVRRIGLDWPAQLASTLAYDQVRLQAHTALQLCPVFGAEAPPPSGASHNEPWHGLQHWLSVHVLGLPAQEWLTHWEKSPAAWLRSWSEGTELWLPRLLRQARALVDKVTPAASFLRVHASATDLRVLADSLHREPGFSRQPLWRAECAETGPWTRLHQTRPELINTPWLRLGSRLAELVRLALADEPARSGAQWLAVGSMTSASLTGMAWVEMARGLLVHHVQLDGTGHDARVVSCQVLAPTEWNFHPHGAVAQALENLHPSTNPDVYREVNLLLSAYDPCVKHEFFTQPSGLANQSPEGFHA